MQIIRINKESFNLWRNQIEKLFNISVKINFPESDFDDLYGMNKCTQVEEYLEDDSAIVFGAVENESLAGWVWCHEINRMGTRRMHIAEIAVEEKWYRKGIGNLLLESVKQYAKEHGYHEIDLLVTTSNVKAVKFYEKAGFEPERYLMKKSI